MTSRVRNLNQADRESWASYVRHVRALAGRVAPAVAEVAKRVEVAAPAVRPAAAVVVARPRGAPAPAVVTGLQPAGLDNATWGKFRGGKMAPVRTLDLHGKTAQVAFGALERFLAEAYADQVRCVEVITGRGSGEAGGVIRRELPMWLNLPRLRPLVLALAHPHARNCGERAGADQAEEVREGRPSFLKKRSKKLLLPAGVRAFSDSASDVLAGPRRACAQAGDKSFLLLFCKKEGLACL